MTHFTTPHGPLTKDEALQAALNWEMPLPAPYYAIVNYNMAQYSNKGTISGSSLEQPCYGKNILMRLLDYEQDPLDLHFASYRGSNVHDALERVVKGHDEFGDWMVEDRFFAILTPEDEILPLTPTLDSEGKEDWVAFAKTCDDLREQGCIILSGQVDSYDKKHKVLVDYKTAKFVFDKAKPEWIAQLNMYRLLLMLHGHDVSRIVVLAMDASKAIQIEIPLEDLNEWVYDFLIPRVRLLHSLKDVFTVEGAAEYCTPNFLCDGNNRDKRVYCPMKSQCPAWVGVDA